jgi:hypothetical protein
MTVKRIESHHLAMRAPPHDPGAFRYRASVATTKFSRKQCHLGPGVMGRNHRPTSSMQEGSRILDSNPSSPGMGALPPKHVKPSILLEEDVPTLALGTSLG